MNANRNTRKIALTPAATYLVAMPAHYDPARVTTDDLAHDGALCPARAELAPLHTATSALWEQALDAWGDALTACDDGDAGAAVEALTRASQIAAECGGNDEELRALALLDGA